MIVLINELFDNDGAELFIDGVLESGLHVDIFDQDREIPMEYKNKKIYCILGTGATTFAEYGYIFEYHGKPWYTELYGKFLREYELDPKSSLFVKYPYFKIKNALVTVDGVFSLGMHLEKYKKSYVFNDHFAEEMGSGEKKKIFMEGDMIRIRVYRFYLGPWYLLG